MLGAVFMGSAARRIVVVLTLVLGTPAGMIIAGATPQASAACSPTSRCWAIAYNKNTATNHGVFGRVNAHCLYMPNNETSFVTNEIWDNDSSASNWEEAGLYSGLGNNIPYGNKNWFWADKRPGQPYDEHDQSTTANTDTGYRVSIEYGGNDTWYIYGNGDYTRFGTSVNQSATLITGQGGTEYTAGSGSGIRNQGKVGDLERKSSGDTWFGWGANAGRYWNGYITPFYTSGTSTVSWTGPC